MRFVLFRVLYRARLLGLALTAALLMAACGGGGSGGGGAAQPAAAPATTMAPVQAAPADAADAAKVSANKASEDELASAFQAAGVPNAEKWAEEVAEYRPYDEPTFAKLRKELAKYNPAPGVVDKIIATLTL
jgi:hypothetical protein